MTSQGAPEAGAWKTVPAKLTREMAQAAKNAAHDAHGITFTLAEVTLAYEAAIAASPSPPPGVGGWLDISTAPKDRTAVIVAVPDRDRTGYYVGEAYFDSGSSDEGDWWWAGTSNGEYADSSITEGNFHKPELWQPLPAEPGSTLAAPPVGVAVVKLEWDRESPTEWKPETWRAQSLVGEYDIQREKDGTFSGFAPNAGTDLFSTLDAAKSAAQADFERRIRSALVPSPLLKQAEEALRKIASRRVIPLGKSDDESLDASAAKALYDECKRCHDVADAALARLVVAS